jgi:hypothetical protein
MKRTGRWLFNFAAAVSLALCLAMILLWVRSQSKNDFARYLRDIEHVRRVYLGISSGFGRIAISYQTKTPTGAPVPPLYEDLQTPGFRYVLGDPLVGSWSPAQMRFGWQHTVVPLPHVVQEYRQLDMPDWLLVLVFAILPSMVFVRVLLASRRRRRSARGRCAACGYDLRATPDRCPECGAIPEGAKGAAE